VGWSVGVDWSVGVGEREGVGGGMGVAVVVGGKVWVAVAGWVIGEGATRLGTRVGAVEPHPADNITRTRIKGISQFRMTLW
jgi:hypothetical protein